MEENSRFSLEEITASVQALLLSDEPLDKNENLIRQGMDSLAVMRIVDEYRKKGSRVRFAELIEDPYLESWHKKINRLRKTGKKDTKKNPGRYEPYELTPVQLSYFIGRGDEQELGGIDCHAYLELGGKTVDESRLNEAYKKLQLHHPMLHTRFLPDGRQQEIENYFPRELTVCDVRNEAEFIRLRDSISHRKLDIENAQTFDIVLVRFPDGRQKILYDVSLIIADVISFQKILDDLCRLYNGEELAQETASFSFSRYIKDNPLNNRIEDQEYWAGEIDKIPDNPRIPLKTRPEKVDKVRFKTRMQEIAPSVWQNIKRKASAESVTPAMVLLTVYAAVLDRWSETAQFNINLPVFNRNISEPWMEDVIADFSNTLIFDVDFSGKETCISRVKKNQKHFYERMAHANYSGVNVLREMKKRGRSSNVVFAYNVGQPLISGRAEKTLGSLEYMVSQTPQVWIDFQVYDLLDGGLLIKWDSVDDLFYSEMLDEMFGCLENYLVQLGTSESAWDKEIVFDELEERVQNIPFLHYEKRETKPVTLIDDFLHFAETRPDHIAVTDGASGEVITYAGLKDKAMRLAALLKKNNVKKDDLVAVTLNKGASQIVAVLGILIVGAGYVPVGVKQPAGRAGAIYRRGNIQHVVTSRLLAAESVASGGSQTHTAEGAYAPCAPRQERRGVLEYPGSINRIYIEDLAACEPAGGSEAEPDQTAYVIFTSGSTGEPKGVVIKHRSAVNTIRDVNSRFHVKEDDRVLAISALDFDLSVYDIFGILSAGGTIITISDAMQRDPESWVDLLDRYGVTIWNTVPAIMNMLLMWIGNDWGGRENRLRLALLSGDWIPLDLPEKFYRTFRDAELVSLGGATEASIWSNYYPVSVPLQENWNSVPYGYPLSNQLFKIIDKRGRNCPLFVRGELVIEGDGVADGYLHDAERTGASFFTDQGMSAYRTGDLGRFRENAVIEFLGRKDFQVKVNGYRIELSEIERVLKGDSSVGEAVCILAENEKIHGFVTPRQTGENNACFDVMSEEDAERILLESDELFRNCRDISDAEYLLKELYDDMDHQAVRFVKELIGSSDLDEKLIADSYKKYYDLLSAISEKTDDKPADRRRGQRNDATHRPRRDKNAEAFLNWKGCIPQIKDILYGRKEAADLLMSPDNTFTPSMLSERIPLNRFKYSVICDTILRRIEKAHTSLKIAVLAVRQGGVLQYLDKILTGRECEIDYLDNTVSFFNSIRSDLGSGIINYRYYDLNAETVRDSDLPDGLFSYDIIISDNSLHRCCDIERTVNNLVCLLKQDGMALLVEQNHNSSIVLSVAGLYEEGFGNLNDRELPLLTAEEWADRLGKQFYITDLLGKQLGDSMQTCMFALKKKHTFAMPEANVLAEIAKSKLPPYMLPQVISVISRIPCTENGKIDRKTLAGLAADHIRSQKSELALPENETEKDLVQCFEKVLQISGIRVTDEFFSLGGDSLSAIVLMNTIKEKTGFAVTLPQIFTLQTARKLSEVIRGKEEEDMETGEI